MPADATYTPEAKRQVLYAFWKKYVGTPVILLGGSIGGAFAIDFAIEHPDAVHKLVLVDPQVSCPSCLPIRCFYPCLFYTTGPLDSHPH